MDASEIEIVDDVAQALVYIVSKVVKEVEAAKAVSRAKLEKEVEAAKDVARANVEKEVEAAKAVSRAKLEKEVEAAKAVSRAKAEKEVEAAKAVSRAKLEKEVEAAKAVSRAKVEKDVEAAKAVSRAKAEKEVETAKAVARAKAEKEVGVWRILPGDDGRVRLDPARLREGREMWFELCMEAAKFGSKWRARHDASKIVVVTAKGGTLGLYAASAVKGAPSKDIHDEIVAEHILNIPTRKPSDVINDGCVIEKVALRKSCEGEWAVDEMDGKRNDDEEKWHERVVWLHICEVLAKFSLFWWIQTKLKNKKDAQRKRRMLAKKARSAAALKPKQDIDDTTTGHTCDDVKKALVADTENEHKDGHDIRGHTPPSIIKLLDKSQTTKSTTSVEETNHREQSCPEPDSLLVAMTSHLQTAPVYTPRKSESPTNKPAGNDGDWPKAEAHWCPWPATSKQRMNSPGSSNSITERLLWFCNRTEPIGP